MEWFHDYRYWFCIVSLFMLVNWFTTDMYHLWLMLEGVLLGSVLTVLLMAMAYYMGPGG